VQLPEAEVVRKLRFNDFDELYNFCSCNGISVHDGLVKIFN